MGAGRDLSRPEFALRRRCALSARPASGEARSVRALKEGAGLRNIRVLHCEDVLFRCRKPGPPSMAVRLGQRATTGGEEWWPACL